MRLATKNDPKIIFEDSMLEKSSNLQNMRLGLGSQSNLGGARMSRMLNRHGSNQEMWQTTMKFLKTNRKPDLKLRKVLIGNDKNKVSQMSTEKDFKYSLLERSSAFHYDDYGQIA